MNDQAKMGLTWASPMQQAHNAAAPPQRKEWVGLTAKDLAEIPANCYEGAIWADAKLKEKNA